MKDSIRLVLIGDTDVGKSSLISSFVSRHFPEEVPPVVADVTIPPQVPGGQAGYDKNSFYY